MIGKELEVELKEKTQEQIAKKVIEDILKVIKDRKELLKQAEDKLAETLEKEIELIKEKDSNHWDW